METGSAALRSGVARLISYGESIPFALQGCLLPLCTTVLYQPSINMCGFDAIRSIESAALCIDRFGIHLPISGRSTNGQHYPPGVLTVLPDCWSILWPSFCAAVKRETAVNCLDVFRLLLRVAADYRKIKRRPGQRGPERDRPERDFLLNASLVAVFGTNHSAKYWGLNRAKRQYPEIAGKLQSDEAQQKYIEREVRKASASGFCPRKVSKRRIPFSESSRTRASEYADAHSASRVGNDAPFP